MSQSRNARWPGMFVLAVASLLLAPVAAASDGGSDADHLKTFYEAEAMSPQNMDYDRENKMFIAHPGWLDDQLIHYYKFQMYTPGTYPSTVQPGSTPTFPVAPLYLLTTDGTFAGLVADQKPILRYHTKDGENYSDFVQVVWVQVPEGYTANTWKSYHDMEAATPAPTMTESDIVANVPVVPSGSSLQHPDGGLKKAPITPLMVWYDGHEVQTFVFETTSQAFADHYNPLTRTGDAGAADSGFEITVSAFATPNQVSTAPIFHVNQYFTGVTPGVNNGGPANMGQRNVIGVDRLDSGYSPLWQVAWVTQLPVGYRADQASHPDQFTKANGFEVTLTPMYVNCPNIGPHGGGARNAQKAASFDTTAELGHEDAEVTVEGALIMRGDEEVTAKLNGQEFDTVKTGMMGAWAFTVPGAALDAGSNMLTIEDASGAKVGEFSVMGPEAMEPTDPGTGTGNEGSGSGSGSGGEGKDAPKASNTPGPAAGLAVLAVAGAALMAARRRRA